MHTQGLADTFILLGMAFDSDEATQLNKEIFECIYYAALETSCELAKVDGEPPPPRGLESGLAQLHQGNPFDAEPVLSKQIALAVSKSPARHVCRPAFCKAWRVDGQSTADRLSGCDRPLCELRGQPGQQRSAAA